MGSALVDECERRDVDYLRGKRAPMAEVIKEIERCDAELVINAAAFIPHPTVDACKDHMPETFDGNVAWPYRISDACDLCDVPLIHLSTGCLFDEQREYTEHDTPTRGWNGYCGFYVGTKLMAEHYVSMYERAYILRLRLPFDEVDHPRNYLTKLTKFDNVFEHVNSLTHRGDFAKWALDLWQADAPYGTYHCVNTGQISAEGLVINMGQKNLIPKIPKFVKSPGTTGARLSNAKLAGVIGPIRTVHEAVADSIMHWRKG
jgi:3,5-epimerase/4-reductase